MPKTYPGDGSADNGADGHYRERGGSRGAEAGGEDVRLPMRLPFANFTEVVATMRRESLSTKLAPHLRSKCFGWPSEARSGEVRDIAGQ